MLYEWHEQMSVGIDVLDQENKKLIGYLDALQEALESNRSKEILSTTLKEATIYIINHFKHEEEFFSNSEYPDKKEHIDKHEEMTMQLKEIHNRYLLERSDALLIEFVKFLKEWHINHVQEMDMKYANFVKSQSAS